MNQTQLKPPPGFEIIDLGAEPPSVDQAARPNIGETIDQNRPLVANPDGSFSTEETITENIDGVWHNLPTIVNGERVSPDQAVDLFRSGSNPSVGQFGSMEEAVSAAQRRTEEIGKARLPGVEPSPIDPASQGFTPPAPPAGFDIVDSGDDATQPNPDGTFGKPPEGMVLDPETGQMVDTQAIAQQGAEGVSGALVDAAGKTVQGVPFIGEGIDELTGAVAGLRGNNEEIATQVARNRLENFEEENPKTALGLRVAGGVGGSIPLAVAAAPAIAAAAPASLAGQMATGAVAGSVGGGLEGAASGFLAGEDPESRKAEALSRGVTGTVVGGGLGVVAPMVAAGVKGAANKVLDAVTAGKKTKQLGLSKASQEPLVRAMEADEAFKGEGARNIALAGDDAMLADAGQSAKGLLDTSIQRSGPAATAATRAVETRAATASRRLTKVMDDVLGEPEGVKSVAKNISRSSSAKRQAAYDLAYSQPIDYARKSNMGEESIEEVLDRIPDRILKGAIQTANEAMQEAGLKNKQILAQIADDGTVTFKELPNVQQLDEIKKALGSIGAEAVDNFGRPTGEGLRAGRLARNLRDALGRAVPDYKKAVKLGGDKIAEDNALRLGQSLLTKSKNSTREVVKEAVSGFTEAERKAAMKGLRSQIDEEMANVQRTIMDGNTDVREAMAVVKKLSSKANHEKVKLVVGRKRADILFSELNRTIKALDLRASVADNSKTFARLNTKESVSAHLDEGMGNALRSGEPLNFVKRATQAAFNRSPAARQGIEDQIYSEIVGALTSPRGAGAQTMLSSLGDISAQVPANEALARVLSQRATPSVVLPAYHTATQLLSSELQNRSPAAR